MMKIASIVALVGAASLANAGFTTVQTGGTFGGGGGSPSDSTSVANILSRMYGGDFDTTATGMTGSIYGTLSFAGVTATRINDFDGLDDVLNQNDLGSVLQLGAGAVAGSTDQVWQDGTVTFEARARYAGYSQFFGFRSGASGGSGFSNTAISVDPGFDGSSSNGISIGSGSPFRWMRANDSGGTDNVQLSLASENAQEANVSNDQMIAFEINDGSGTRKYVLFFEDIDNGGDRDFNDLAIELSVIPLPSGAALGMAGLGLLAIRRRGVR